MIEITEKIDGLPVTFFIATLNYDQRQKSRLRIELDGGREAGIMLERGTILRDGDFLRATNGMVIQIRAAKEEVTIGLTLNSHLFSRACYHLGNRHVPLQIEENWLSFQRDHVLEEMVTKLGLEVKHAIAAFQPEGGAYKEESQLTHHHHD
jgi:urease accessory protein